MLKLHVTYELDKYVIQLDSKADGNQIIEAVKEKFKISMEKSISLQFYDKDFEDWVNVEPTSSIPNMSKLQVCQITGVSDDSADNGTIPAIVDSVQSDSTSKAHKEEERSTATSCKVLQPWPMPFVFPSSTLRAGVIEKLESGEPLSRGERSHITDSVYTEVTKYTYYPKEWQYSTVVNAFLERFPKLQTNDNLASNLWRQRIQYRFQNDRRRRDARCIPGKRRLSEQNAPSLKKSAIYYLNKLVGEGDMPSTMHNTDMTLELSTYTVNQT